MLLDPAFVFNCDSTPSFFHRWHCHTRKSKGPTVSETMYMHTLTDEAAGELIVLDSLTLDWVHSRR